MFERIDAIIEGVDVITRGTVKAPSVDWKHIDEEAITITAATFSLFLDDLTPVAAIQNRSTLITTSPRGDTRAVGTISASETLALDAGPHFFVWKLTFGDGQTRWARGSVRVRSVP